LLAPLANRVDEDAAVLLVSELVNNAIIHTSATEVEVQITFGPDSLLVGVRDPDPVLPVMRPPAVESSGGRGLAIVARCSQQWGVSGQPDGGKCVWFRLGVPPEVAHR
jgi:anti-sigma regulatory factor (Ser/Thr protein kinase)